MVARTAVTQFEGESAIVVERYDRRLLDGRLLRIHQEDVCQALGVRPDRKYQNEGGPGPGDVARLLRRVMPPGWRTTPCGGSSTHSPGTG